MAVTRLSAQDVAGEALETLRLPSGIDLISDEGIAASLRRIASFSCPTTSAALVRSTVDVLRGLPGFSEETSQHVSQTVENLTSYGDLLELPVEQDDGYRRNLFLGPPSYVYRAGSHRALVIGIRSEGAPLLSDDLMQCLEYAGHARILRPLQGTSVDDLLGGEGLIPLPAEQWLHAPRSLACEEFVASYEARLESQGLPGEVELRVIDPSSSPTYYRGRWRPLKSDDGGFFVGRRPQAFGADLWCFVGVESGRIVKLIDLPIEDSLAPGADEAWRLQAALDASRGTPQKVRTSPADEDRTVLEFFSPVPSWLQRRLDVVATRSQAPRGALFAYVLAPEEVEEELDFARSHFWLNSD